MTRINIDDLVLEEQGRKKEAFYASDINKPAFDIYHAFKGTPKTNPTKWFETLRMGAGNGVEDQMLRVLKASGIVNDDYDQHTHGKIEFEYEGVPIHGRIDAITTNGLPIEIKSINNKNKWDISAYEDGYPRENYVGQLATYMHALGVPNGFLFVASVDGLSRFIFECERLGDLFRCGNVVWDMTKEFDRWKKIYEENILKDVEPDPMEYLYKYPVDEIDWTKISKDKISKARNNNAVIGDYQVQYSPWKDLWINKQGSTLGYTAEEIVKIKEMTAGYSTKK